MTDLHLFQEEKPIILALTSPIRYRENSLTLLREVLHEGYGVIFIAIHQPCTSLREFYARNGIDVSQIFFIDAITRYATGFAPAPSPEAVYVNSPGDHTAIGIAVTEALKMPETRPQVIYIDSINAMLIHSNSINLSRFIHFITSKLRVMNVGGILIAVEKGLDPFLMSQLTGFSDCVLDLSDDQPQA
jgi:archaellum biogenesis ATPase FlaH